MVSGSFRVPHFIQSQGKAQNLQLCEICDDLKKELKKFRLRKEKNVAAILMKIDTNAMKVIIEERYQALNPFSLGEALSCHLQMKYILSDSTCRSCLIKDCNIEELQEELPERQPRFLVVSYVRNHDDGRVSYPLIFVYICPRGCKVELSMMYAGTRNALKNELKLTKDFELRDVEDFTTEWLEEKLSFFR